MNPSLSRIRTLLRSRDELYRDAYEGKQFDAVYFAMLVLACLIALLGLLMNSPAIIIGAMLISPLMGPILSCGLALTTADWLLGKKATRNVVLSVVEVVVIAAVGATLSPLKDLTPEILARTNPNLMDLLVAFFSGLAGTLALASRKGALTILPGVAIATAVMPPLATVGYGLSTQQWEVARGAFMLFFTNFMSIVISADLVFFLVGFRPREHELPPRHPALVRYRTAIALVVLFALSIPLLQTLVHVAEQVRLRKQVARALSSQLDKPGHRRLDSLNLRITANGISVDASVQTAEFIEPQEIRALEAAVTSKVGRSVRLQLEQLQLARKQPAQAAGAKTQDYVTGGVVKASLGPRRPLSAAEEISKLQDQVQSSLAPLLIAAGVPDLRVRSVSMLSDGVVRVEITGAEAAPISPDAWTIAAAGLAKEVGAPVQLTGGLVILEQTYTIKYRRNSVRPVVAELTRVRQFLQAHGTLSHTFISAASDPPALSAKRIDYLARRFSGAGTATAAGTGPGLSHSDNVERNTVLVRLVQTIEISGKPPAPATGPSGE